MYLQSPTHTIIFNSLYSFTSDSFTSIPSNILSPNSLPYCNLYPRLLPYHLKRASILPSTFLLLVTSFSTSPFLYYFPTLPILFLPPSLLFLSYSPPYFHFPVSLYVSLFLTYSILYSLFQIASLTVTNLPTNSPQPS